ncbi:CDP-alcohol phosphatidyltransferase family protein [Candidatus Nomurabacteria bacterium]|nr:CDP-alcohol phosphatidyltransferase family protein [Candidatus Nomurabacteria bacterium]
MNKITISDRILAATFLKLIPSWVTPNHLTIFRFLTIPFVLYFLLFENYAWGIPLFVISAFSDALDGAKARTNNQITEWGKMFDPVADKMLIGTVAAIVISTSVSHILALSIIGLELLIILAAFYRKRYNNENIEARLSGKIKMICQSFGVGFLLLHLAFPLTPFLFGVAIILLMISILFALISLFVYNSI